jgi:hypothetical protein
LIGNPTLYLAQQLDDVLAGIAPPEEPVKQQTPPAKIDRSINYSKWNDLPEDITAPKPKQDIDELKKEAKEYMSKKKYDRAVTAYTKILLFKPDAVTFLNRAMAHLSLLQVFHEILNKPVYQL